MSYKPQVDDYVIWNRGDLVHKGWVYFADENILQLKQVSNLNLIVNIQRMKNTNIFTHYYSAIRGFGKN